MSGLWRIATLLIAAGTWSSAWAEREVPCPFVASAPVVDGLGTDNAWTEAPAVSVRDAVANIDLALKCTFSAGHIHFLVSFPDADENRAHKSLQWEASEKRYVLGPDREDTLVLKWNMEPFFTDLSLSADEGYRADIWFWKSVRTDSQGFADDKYQVYAAQPIPKSVPRLSKSVKRFYLSRRGDKGRSAYKSVTPAQFSGQTLAGYTHRMPEGSRADVRAKGHWSDGQWTVEFSRALVTGNDDDVQFSRARRFQFGVSRYEVAGRPEDPSLQIPLYGSGEVGESLILVFSGQKSAQR